MQTCEEYAEDEHECTLKMSNFILKFNSLARILRQGLCIELANLQGSGQSNFLGEYNLVDCVQFVFVQFFFIIILCA